MQACEAVGYSAARRKNTVGALMVFASAVVDARKFRLYAAGSDRAERDCLWHRDAQQPKNAARELRGFIWCASVDVD